MAKLCIRMVLEWSGNRVRLDIRVRFEMGLVWSNITIWNMKSTLNYSRI